MVSPSEVCPYADLMPEQYAKQGMGAIVEDRVSAIIADPDYLDHQFDELKQDLSEAVPDGNKNPTAPALRRARLTRQVGETVAYYQIYQLAIPQMTAWHREHGTLEMPEGESFDFYQDIPWEVPDDDPPLYTRVLTNGFWMRQAAQTFLGESAAETSHPYHRLHHHLDRSWRDYVQAFRNDERSRTGQSEDAEWNDTEEYTYKELITGTSHATGSQGADVIAAGAVHCIAHNDATDFEAIAPGIIEKLPHMRWMAAMDRNSGKRRAEIDGLNPLVVPRGAAKLLIRRLAQVGSRQSLVEPFKQYRVFRTEHFTPSELISNGPPSQSGTCSGDVNAKISDPKHRQNTAEFYAEVGLPQLGHSSTFSSATFSLAIGNRLAETTFLPELAEFLTKSR